MKIICPKIKRFTIIAALIFYPLFNAQAADLTVSNLLSNGAVEIASGSLPFNWTNNASGSWSTEAYVSESRSLKLTDSSGTDSYHWLSAKQPALQNRKYIIEWDWRYSNVTTPFFVQVRFYNSSNQIISTTEFYSGTGSTNNKFIHGIELFHTPPNTVSLDVVLSTSASGTGTVYFDNIIVRSAPNLILNDDMEFANGTDPDSWRASSTNAVWATDLKLSGSRSLKVIDPAFSDVEYWHSRAIPIIQGLPTFLCWKWAYQNVTGQGMIVRVRWWTDMTDRGWCAGTNISAQDFYSPVGTNTAFTYNIQSVIPPEGAKFADVMILGGDAGSGTVWVDDVEFIQLDSVGYSKTKTYVPCAKEPVRLISATKWSSQAQLLAVTTLQGIVAQVRPEIHINYISSANDATWRDLMRDVYGIKYFKNSNYQWYLHNFRDNLINNRYILCDINSNPDSVNVATSLAGRFGAVVIDASIESVAQSEGLIKFMDVRTGLTEQLVLDNYAPELNSKIAQEFQEGFTSARDVSTFARVYTFFKDYDLALRTNVWTQLLDDHGISAGFWPRVDGPYSERDYCNNTSQNKVTQLPWGQSRNITTYSGLVDRNIQLKQNTRTSVTVDNTKHYVTFIPSDGGCPKVTMFDLPTNPSWFASPLRGTMNIGWSLSCTMSEYAPHIIKYLYDNSSNGMYKDYWVAGSSGFGYIYPNKYGGSLATLAKMTAETMEKADLTELLILDGDSPGINPARLSPFTAYDQIKAIFYNSANVGANVRWSNGKPIINAREKMGSDGIGITKEAMVTLLNDTTQCPAKPNSKKGYSYIVPQWWSSSLDDIKYVIDRLSSSRKVVTPHEMIEIYNKALSTPPWTFEDDEEGWSGEANSGATGSWDWDSSGALKLSATGGGSDWHIRYFKKNPVSPGATTFSFKVKAASSSSDAKLSVSVKDVAGYSIILQPSTLITSTTYSTRTYDISSLAGTTPTFYIECADDSDGNSILLVDDINITGPGISGTIKINNDANYTSSQTVTLSLAASSSSGIAQMRFSNDNVNWSAWENYSTSKIWNLSAGDGPKTVYVRYKDNSGNVSGNFLDNIILDSTAPAISSVTSPAMLNAGTITVSYTGAVDNLSGLQSVALWYRKDTGGWVNSGFSQTGSSGTFNFSAIGDGIYYFACVATDKAGNSSASPSGNGSSSTVYDATAPTGSIIINSGAAFTKTAAVAITVSASDALSGVSQMRFSNDGSDWSAWESYAGVKSWTLSSGDGTKTVYAQFRDNAGNWSSWVADQIGLDTTAPSPGVVSGPSATTEPTITLTQTGASDALSGIKATYLYYKKNSGTWTNSGLSLQGGSGSYIFTFPSGIGTYYFAQTAEDNAGNVSPAPTGNGDCFVKYGVPPELTLLINDDSLFTSNTSVTLHVNAIAGSSPVAEMRFSNNQTDWSDWEPYSTTKQWIVIPIQSQATVWGQIRDTVGNVSNVSSDSVWIGTASSIAQAKLLTGGLVFLDDVLVTGSFNGFIYVQGETSPFGIKVLGANLPEKGACIDLVGFITMIDHEKAISLVEYKSGNQANIKPVYMPVKHIGGSNWQWEETE